MRLPQWLDVERRYFPGVVSQLAYRTSKVVGAHTHLDADQARRHVGKSCNDFVASDFSRRTMAPPLSRPIRCIVFLPGSIPIVVIVLVGLRDMGVLLLTCPRPAHCKAPVGREHGRSSPFSDMAQPMIDWNDGANASRSTALCDLEERILIPSVRASSDEVAAPPSNGALERAWLRRPGAALLAFAAGDASWPLAAGPKSSGTTRSTRPTAIPGSIQSPRSPRATSIRRMACPVCATGMRKGT